MNISLSFLFYKRSFFKNLTRMWFNLHYAHDIGRITWLHQRARCLRLSRLNVPRYYYFFIDSFVICVKPHTHYFFPKSRNPSGPLPTLACAYSVWTCECIFCFRFTMNCSFASPYPGFILLFAKPRLSSPSPWAPHAHTHTHTHSHSMK